MKCIITIEDTGPGQCTVNLDFDPPIEMLLSKNTAASGLALAMLEMAADRTKEIEE